MFLSGTKVLVGLGKNRFVINETADCNVQRQRKSQPLTYLEIRSHGVPELQEGAALTLSAEVHSHLNHGIR